MPNLRNKGSNRCDPLEITIIGLKHAQPREAGPNDTNHKSKADHPLYAESNELPINHPLMQELVTLIEMNGWRGAISLTRDGDLSPAADGRRRVRAAREVNRLRAKRGEEPISIAWVLDDLGDAADRIMHTWLMNESRQVVSLETRAENALMLTRLGKDPKWIAEHIGRDEQTVKGWLASLNAAPEVRELAKSGKLSDTGVVRLTTLSVDDQRAAVAKINGNGHANGNGHVRVTEAQARAAVKAVKQDKRAAQTTIEPRDEGRVSLPSPSKRLVRKVLADEAFDEIEASPRKLLEWTIGERDPKSIKGLMALIHRANGNRPSAEA